MPLIDLSTPIGKLRYRLGDYLDIPRLPDDVYQSALDEKNNNMRAATVLCGQYILAGLAFDSQQRMGVIEVYGNQVFEQYVQFLKLVLKDPAFNGVCPLPYVAGADTLHPILQFKEDFTNAQNRPTPDERLHQIASGPFDPYGGDVANSAPPEIPSP
jgi:hypothetical protein